MNGAKNDTPDLLVVGASFAGLACARVAALAGLRVVVWDKKAEAGEKLHTTGIVVKDAFEREPLLQQTPAHLLRRINGVRLYAPKLQHIDLYAPNYWFCATDTPGLLRWLAQQAEQAGAQLAWQHNFVSAQRDTKAGRWSVTNAQGEILRPRYLVGADGPSSRVARALGLSCNRQFLFGIEYEYQNISPEPGFLHCFINRRLAPGYLGWALAGVNGSQIGLAQRWRAHATPDHRVALAQFLQTLQGFVTTPAAMSASPNQGAPCPASSATAESTYLQPCLQPYAVRAGLIPCGGRLKHVSCAGALLVGDAAGLVSPLTAGGIHTGLQSGRQAGEAVAAHLRGQGDDPALWLPAQYPRFAAKRVLRLAFDHLQTDWMFNVLLGTPLLRRVAQRLYFHQ